MLAAIALQAIDPMNLPIGTPGQVEVRVGEIVDTQSGTAVQMSDVLHSAKGKRFVYVGETHDNPDAHQWQAKIVEALATSGRGVIVGLEMYTRPKQTWLDLWTLGRLTEEEFVAKSDWKGQWGFDFALYRPIFDAARKTGSRMVALNVPRDWVRAVGRGGEAALPEVAMGQLPELFLGNEQHKQVFVALMGGHPPASPNIYTAQVLWDEGMADTAIKYLKQRYVSENTAFVVVAGNGHIMYSQGIPYRVVRRTGMQGVAIVTVDIPKGQTSMKVARGLGDFVIGVPAVEAK